MESVSLSYTVIRKVYIRTINQITGREQSNALNCIHFTYPVAGVPPIKLNPCLNAVAVDRICAFAVKLVTGLVTRNERIRVLLPICFESLSPLSFSLVKFHGGNNYPRTPGVSSTRLSKPRSNLDQILLFSRRDARKHTRQPLIRESDLVKVAACSIFVLILIRSDFILVYEKYRIDVSPGYNNLHL